MKRPYEKSPLTNPPLTGTATCLPAMKRPDEKPTLANELSKGTATGVPDLKRPYEKPTLTVLAERNIRAGWLSGDGKASPQGTCASGLLAGGEGGNCGPGGSPGSSGACSSGTSASPTNYCLGGTAVYAPHN
jgi:hypothetical protein